MTATIEQKIALRMKSDSRNRLTVSRGAKSKGNRYNNFHTQTGNPSAVIKTVFPEYAGNINKLTEIREFLLTWSEKNNSSDLPNPQIMRKLVSEHNQSNLMKAALTHIQRTIKFEQQQQQPQVTNDQLARLVERFNV